MYQKFVSLKLPKFEKTVQTNLKITHRFGSNLAKVLDKFVYKFGFESALNSDTNLFFIDSASNIDEAIERSSLEEVLIIKELVKKFEGKSFVILTPYKKQVKLLKEHLDRKYFELDKYLVNSFPKIFSTFHMYRSDITLIICAYKCKFRFSFTTILHKLDITNPNLSFI